MLLTAADHTDGSIHIVARMFSIEDDPGVDDDIAAAVRISREGHECSVWVLVQIHFTSYST
jgi:hypothetical protein